MFDIFTCDKCEIAVFWEEPSPWDTSTHNEIIKNCLEYVTSAKTAEIVVQRFIAQFGTGKYSLFNVLFGESDPLKF